MALPSYHIATHPIAAEVIRPAPSAQVFLPEAPHLFGWRVGAFAGDVFGLFAAEHVPTAADVWINWRSDPCEFSANLFEV